MAKMDPDKLKIIVDDLNTFKAYKTIFENAYDAMIICHPVNNIIVEANNKAMEIYGVNKDKLIGKSIKFFIKDVDNTKQVIDKLLRNEISTSFETIHLSKDGVEKFLEVNSSLIEAGNTKLILSVIRDITRRKKAENSTKIYVEKLKNLNESKDKLFNIISHDLRGPFSSLLGYSEILLNEFNTISREEIYEISNHLNSTSKNLLSLIEGLLNWSRVQMGKVEFNPKKVNLLEVISFVFNLLKGAAIEKKILLNNFLETDCIVLADEIMLTSVIQNLVSNAIKFTNENGIVEVYAIEYKDYYEISVQDSGIGISEENINKLFKLDSSFTTQGTKNEKGTGLGLLLCKEFVEKNGGKIKVFSKKNDGSIFTFTLPKYVE